MLGQRGVDEFLLSANLVLLGEGRQGREEVLDVRGVTAWTAWCTIIIAII